MIIIFWISPKIYERFAGKKLTLLLSRSESVWTGASMDPQGDWYLSDGSETMFTNAYGDMRRDQSGTWIPPDTILDVNGTTIGCLEISKNGLLNTQLDGQCGDTKKPACEYKGIINQRNKKN